MATKSDNGHTCTHCQEPTEIRCSCCVGTYYCSDKCKEANHKTHHLLVSSTEFVIAQSSKYPFTPAQTVESIVIMSFLDGAFCFRDLNKTPFQAYSTSLTPESDVEGASDRISSTLDMWQRVKGKLCFDDCLFAQLVVTYLRSVLTGVYLDRFTVYYGDIGMVPAPCKFLHLATSADIAQQMEVLDVPHPGLWVASTPKGFIGLHLTSDTTCAVSVHPTVDAWISDVYAHVVNDLKWRHTDTPQRTTLLTALQMEYDTQKIGIFVVEPADFYPCKAAYEFAHIPAFLSNPIPLKPIKTVGL